MNESNQSPGHAGHRRIISPIETEAQARELPEVRAARAAFDADPGTGKMTPHNLRMLLDACGAAGVVIGAYDVRIMEWLAGFEPEICAVVAGLISRASSVASIPEGIARELFRDAIAAQQYRTASEADKRSQAGIYTLAARMLRVDIGEPS